MAKEKTANQKSQTSSSENALVPAKELNQLKGNTSTLVTSAQALVIKTTNDLPASADLLKAIKEAQSVVKKRKEEITRPLMQSLASARDLFKPFEGAFEEAEKVVKGKIAQFQTEEEARIEAEKEKIVEKVDSGKMKGATAVKKLGELGGIQTTASGSSGSIQTRTLTKVRVIDEALLPREYLVPDMNKITKAILQDGIEIPGAEKYTEKSIVSR